MITGDGTWYSVVRCKDASSLIAGCDSLIEIDKSDLFWCDYGTKESRCICVMCSVCGATIRVSAPFSFDGLYSYPEWRKKHDR